MTERLFPAPIDAAESSETNTASESVHADKAAAPPNMRLLLFAAIVTCIVMTVFINLLLLPHTKSQSTLSNAVSLLHTKLNDIQTEIASVAAQSQPSSDLQRTVALMTQEVAELKQSVAQLAAARDVQNLSTSITDVKTDVDMQMNDLKTLVSQQHGLNHFVDAKNLPFHVLSVDVISGQPLMSINFQHQVMPLLVGDSLAGWQVMKVSFNHQAAELKNNHGDVVVVTATA